MIGVPFSPPAPSLDPRPRRAPRVRRHLGRLLNLELMQEIRDYNEVDCKAMMEIVRYLRANR